MDDSDHTSASFVSWATNVTKCSNPVFNSVLSRRWGNGSMQQDVLTVLTGITQLIHDKNGRESGAEYYAALLTALNTPSKTKAAEAYLLKLVISRAIPDSLLRATFSEAAKIIMHILNSTPSDDASTSSILKSLLICLGRLLRSQTREAWSTESVRHIYRYILRFVDSEKPTIRKASHTAVLDILIGNPEIIDDDAILIYHPASHQTQDQLCSALRREVRELIAGLHTKESNCRRLLHCLELLSAVLHVLPPKDLKAACECILELVEFPNSLVVSKAFDSLRTLFENQQPTTGLSIELTARLITALYTCQPKDPAIITTNSTQSIGDTHSGFTGFEVLVSWVQCLRVGCGYLMQACNSDTDKILEDSSSHINMGGKVTVSRLVEEHLDRLIRTLLEILTSTPLPKLRKLVSDTLDTVFMNELDDPLINGIAPGILSRISLQLKDCLSLPHLEVWPHVLVLLAHLLRIWRYEEPLAPSQLDANLCDLLRHVVQLRDTLVDGPRSLSNLISTSSYQRKSDLRFPTNVDDNLGEAVIDELDRVCLVALETLGPNVVLTDGLIPLEPIVNELEIGSVDLRRSWILPLLARVVPKSPCYLRFFSENMLPLADRALNVAKSVVSAMATKESKTGGTALITAGITVTRQIWAGLGMFVRQAPRDWSELSTGGLGRRLVKELANTSALRPIILTVFRRLALAAQNSEDGLVAMRGGAKLAIPTMLSLYENAESPGHNSLQQQIRATLAAYFPCLTSKVITSPATLACQKLTSTQNPIYMEILQMVIPHTTPEEISTFLSELAVYLSPTTTPSRVLQKRAYRLLELVCSGSTDSTRTYISNNLDALLNLLHELRNDSIDTIESDHAQPKPDPPTEMIVDQLANLSFAGARKLDRKNRQSRIPWKPRLRCLYHLLCHLVAQEPVLMDKDGDDTVSKSESQDSIRNLRLRNFANLFLPEILASVCEVNRIVRDLAGRLLVNLVMAFAGQTLASASALPGSSSTAAILDTQTIHSLNQDKCSDDTDIDARSDGASSLSRFTCVDEDEIRSTLSMPRGGPQSLQICQALNLIISRLWGCLPPHVPAAVSSGELATQESASRVICHLLRHLRFRRALAFSLGSGCEMSEKIASGILSEASLAASHLSASPHRVLARSGLQLIRLLLAFVALGAVGLPDLVQSLQSLHKAQKRPLRFVVKAILEKMIKKFGRKTIQGMTNTEYQKVVRNSARVMARRERQSTADESVPVDTDAISRRSKSDKALSTHTSEKLLSTPSIHSRASLPPLIHMPRFGELLASSSDEEDTARNGKKFSNAPSVRSKASSKRSHQKDKGPKSLVEELESVAETSGLCRRARKRLLRRSGVIESSDDEYGVSHSSSDIDQPNARLGNKRRVRFADTNSLVSTNRLNAKRARSGEADSRGQSSDLWLVEANPEAEDVLDLSDPRALARHTAFASDAETAKAMTNAFRIDKASKTKSSASFPTVNGRIVIDDTPKLAEDHEPDWSVPDSDDDDEDDTPAAGWSHEPAGASKQSKTARVRIPGSEFTSSKARGDMRRPGQPDPYAYVALGAGLGVSSGKGKTTPQERRRLLRAIGVGRQKRKHSQSMEFESGRSNKTKSSKKFSKNTLQGGRGIRRKLVVPR